MSEYTLSSLSIIHFSVESLQYILKTTMEELSTIWFNGEFKDWHDVQIHGLCHGLHYGSAVFEGIRFYETPKGPAVFRLKEHLDRLKYSADVLEMDTKYANEEITEAILELIRKTGISSGYIRPLITYGYGKMGLNPHGAPIDTMIAMWPWGSYLGKDLVRVKVSPYIRLHPQSVVSDAKVSGHYVNSILASLDAKKEGFDEALLLDHEGNVAEGPGENIFMVQDKKIITVPLGNILGGITRDSVMTIAKDKGYEVIERHLTVEELKTADELFFTGTAAEIQPIESIDDTTIGDGTVGPISQEIKTTYLDTVHGKVEQYDSWLSYA